MTSAPDDPSTFGRYRIEGRLGEGWFGRVLLGVDETGRRVALRFVAAGPAADPGFRDRFRREVQAAAAAPAWFCAPVLDADPDADPPWMTSAYVEGPTLHAFVTANGPLGLQGTAALAERMADGLVALHATGVVHRDLTPSNVVLAEDGPRLIDLGAARAADPTSLAATGHVTGRPEFMAPELLAGGAAAGSAPGPAVDVYSFGALVGFAATGHPPFRLQTAAPLGSVSAGPRAPGEDTAALAPVRVGGEPDLGPIQGRLREVLVACLAEDPAARPTTAQLRDRLTAAVSGAAPTVAVSTTRLPPGPQPVPQPAPQPVPQPAPQPAAFAPTSALPYPPPQPGPYPPAPSAQPATGLRRWWPVVVAAVLAAVVAVGAVLFIVDPSGGGGTPAPAGPTAQAGPPAAPDGIDTVVDTRTDTRFGTDQVRFVTPSGNIACSLSAREARCDVASQTWKLPDKPASCTADFGKGAVVRSSGSGELTCASDSVAGPSLKELGYGTAVWAGGVLCSSRESGVRCENPQTKHGFQVARAAYDLF
jgi:serine/threonine protein kinase